MERKRNWKTEEGMKGEGGGEGEGERGERETDRGERKR